MKQDSACKLYSKPLEAMVTLSDLTVCDWLLTDTTRETSKALDCVPPCVLLLQRSLLPIGLIIRVLAVNIAANLNYHPPQKRRQRSRPKDQLYMHLRTPQTICPSPSGVVLILRSLLTLDHSFDKTQFPGFQSCTSQVLRSL